MPTDNTTVSGGAMPPQPSSPNPLSVRQQTPSTPLQTDTAFRNALQKQARLREKYLAPRDPDFERAVQDYQTRLLGEGDTSRPAQMLKKALAVPVWKAAGQIDPALSEVGRVAILRKVRQQNGTNLTGAEALRPLFAEAGITPEQARRQGITPAITEARVQQNRQMNDLFTDLQKEHDRIGAQIQNLQRGRYAGRHAPLTDRNMLPIESNFDCFSNSAINSMDCWPDRATPSTGQAPL